jgi:mono/diheme cytochrome c family protein
MHVQPHIRTYQMSLPPPPAGTLSVAMPLQPEDISSSLDQKERLARGKIYYTYYCIFCHGGDGSGNGPVGQSYLPAPADLRTPAIANGDERKLLTAIIHGNGHDPLLERVVANEHRPYLVFYIRSLGTLSAPGGNHER